MGENSGRSGKSLLIAPHNDDETLFASFLCLRYRPHVVVCLRSLRMGERSYPHREFRMTFAEREAETACAMEILGCTWEQWEIPDKLPDSDVAHQVGMALERLADRGWDRVFAPAVEEDGQFQHNIVGEMAEVIFPEATHYLTYTKAGRSRDGEEVPYEPDWPAIKMRALACYVSQIKHPSTRPHFVDGGLREYTL